MGIAVGAAGSAESGAGNSTSKLNATTKEGADKGDRATTVTDEDQLGALRFKSKEATPMVLKFNSEQVFHRFAGEKALTRWKIDGTAIAPGVMSWLFEDPEVTKLISHEFNMYLHHRRKVNEKNNLSWLRSPHRATPPHLRRGPPDFNNNKIQKQIPNQTSRKYKQP